MATGFAQYLPHFALNGLSALDAGKKLKPLGASSRETHEPVLPAVAAEERLRAEAKAAAQAAAEAARGEERAAAELRLAAERQRWTIETADRLAERLTDGLREIEAELAASVAGVLTPFLDAALRQRAVDELATTVSLLLKSDRHIELNITGPDDLLAQLRTRLDAYARTIQYTPAGDADVRVTFNDTVIETRIAAWSARMAEAAVEEPHV